MFNVYLAEFLDRNKITQQELADHIGKSQMSVSRYTSKETPTIPRADVWVKIAELIAHTEHRSIDDVLSEMKCQLRESK